jgi:hypothetical protein
MRKHNVSQGNSLVLFKKWLDGMGISRATGWRFRQRGWLKTVNVAGRLYLTSEAIEEFVRRVESGEFAKPHSTPRALKITEEVKCTV